MTVVCTAQLEDSHKCSATFCLISDPDACLEWDCLTYQIIAYKVAQKMYTLFTHQYLWNKFK